jgi:hypothetical protein
MATSTLLPRLTEGWLRRINNLLVHRQFDSPTFRAYKLSMSSLNKVLGHEWVRANITDARRGYLRNDRSTPLARETHFMRIVLLAEMIWNLQDIDGFDACLVQMLSESKIESTYAELEIARMVAIGTSATLRFREPIGRRGDDYDLEVTYPDGIVACADTKCKLEETDITLNTIKNTFAHARRQMPATRPGIVFIKVPRFWLDDMQFAQNMSVIAEEFFRNTQRMVSVKYYTESIVLDQDPHGETTAEVIAYKEHSNRRHRFEALRDKDWTLFPREPSQAPPPRTNHNGMPQTWRRLFFFK